MVAQILQCAALLGGQDSVGCSAQPVQASCDNPPCHRWHANEEREFPLLTMLIFQERYNSLGTVRTPGRSACNRTACAAPQRSPCVLAGRRVAALPCACTLLGGSGRSSDLSTCYCLVSSRTPEGYLKKN